MSSITLASGAIIDGENGVVVFPIGDFMTLKFTFEEWSQFVELVSDMNLVFETNTSNTTFMCGACGTVNTEVEFEEVKEEDIN